jgi:hypothetical protein
MGEQQDVGRMLVRHFFRRFFDNDTIQAGGDTQTSVVRALAMVTMPGLMFAFWLQNQYPQRTAWGPIEDQYFFVMFSFVVMGIVAIFEWEMLFPDRMDFLILSPLPLRARQMLGAKAAALGGFFGLFLLGSSAGGMLILPLITTHTVMVNGHVMIQGDFWRQLYAHTVAVLLAGSFAAWVVLAMGGVLLCVLSAAQFRAASPMVQTAAVTGLVLLLVQYAQYGDSMQPLLGGSLGRMRWYPPFWFLGVYEQLLHGASAPAFAREMARYAWRAMGVAVVVAVVTYPMAWARMRRMTIEGVQSGRRQTARWRMRWNEAMAPRAKERAVFHFIGQTMRRNNRYQVFLAMYCGAGLAFAIACGVRFDARAGVWMVSNRGLHAVMPLLLFWVIAGLRAAFAFPMNLPAAWVFRTTGVSMGECMTAARRWVLLCALGTICVVLAVLGGAGWDTPALMVQAVCGVGLALLLTDGFFLAQSSVPFTRPRMPGKTSLPLMLTLYVGVLPLFCYGMVELEARLERNLMKLLLVALVVACGHAGPALMRGPEEIDEELEGYGDEFQLLGLTAQ